MDEHDLLASPSVSAGGGTAAGGPAMTRVSIDDQVRAVAAAGFSGIAIDLADLRVARGTIGFPRLRRLLDDTGLVWVHIGTLDGWWRAGESRAISDAHRTLLLEGAAMLRASHVIVAADTSPAAVPPSAMRDDWCTLADQTADVGAQLVLDAVPWSNIATVERASKFVREAGQRNGGIAIDVMHALRGGSTIASIRSAVLPSTVATVTLSDGLAHTPPGMTLADEARNARYLPGAGAWDLPVFISTMQELGFDGPWGVDAQTNAFRALPRPEALRRAILSSRAVLDGAEAGNHPIRPAMPTTPAPASAVDLDMPLPVRHSVPHARAVGRQDV